MPKLHYINTNEPGITRTRAKKSFTYHLPTGKKITNPKILTRIKSLAIPPAYQNVWICKSATGHIQAFGYDDQKRKQYIYHPYWTKLQSKKKFQHLLEFGQALPKLRRKISRDLATKKITKEKLLAAVIRLLDTTSIRIGSPQYDSYGLLTLRKDHIKIRNKKIILDFLGKSKIHWHLELKDKSIHDIIKACISKGRKVFEYEDNNKKCFAIRAADVNDYLKKVIANDVSAKEFRTWRASAFFIKQARVSKMKPSEAGLRAIITKVAKHMWNTPTVCKNSYIHPLIMKLYLDKKLVNEKSIKSITHLTKEESQLLHLLKYEAK